MKHKIIHGIKMKKKLILISSIFLITCSSADTNKKPHDENKFSIENASTSIVIIKESLNSFKKMVETSENEDPIILKEYKHTNWDMLNLGIPNNISIIEGVLIKQNFIISKLKYDLSLEIKKNHTQSSIDINTLKNNYIANEKKYKTYLKNTNFID